MKNLDGNANSSSKNTLDLNHMFAVFAGRYPAFSRLTRNPGDRAAIMRDWEEQLDKNQIDNSNLRNGLSRLADHYPRFMPTQAEFIRLCRPMEQEPELGIASLEAVIQAIGKREYRFNPITYHTVRRIGIQKLQHMDDEKLRNAVSVEYAAICDLLRRGTFEDKQEVMQTAVDGNGKTVRRLVVKTFDLTRIPDDIRPAAKAVTVNKEMAGKILGDVLRELRKGKISEQTKRAVAGRDAGEDWFHQNRESLQDAGWLSAATVEDDHDLWQAYKRQFQNAKNRKPLSWRQFQMYAKNYPEVLNA